MELDSSGALICTANAAISTASVKVLAVNFWARIYETKIKMFTRTLIYFNTDTQYV